ncbi:SDR family NAD(P)-dependent oxidoreductase [Burkholderia multivorans]|uniref:SDR family NAD(P)-dependent oxidoreductase n=1 Tax=Burkholderia multivorans TaxID=87883 RepID=UPI0020B29DAF|nr:SDR family oxidoreductase [Burkholderia multivorans]
MNKLFSTGTRRAALCLAAMVGLGMSSPSVVAEAQADEHRHARGGQKIVLTAADGRQAQATLLDNAKHAVVGTIRHAAKELAPFGIRTNGVAPGVIMTPLIAKAFGVPPEKADELVQYLVGRLGSKQAMGRYGSAEDVANAALFFASDLSAYVSGTVMPVDGGISSYTLSTSDEEIFAAAQEFARSLT